MRRVLEPELLDELPPDDPDAIRSRRDLRRINFLMGNVPLLARLLLERHPAPPGSVLELGAGDGTTMLALARRLARVWRGPVELRLLDLQPVIRAGTLRAFRELGWTPVIVGRDLRDYAREMPPAEVAIANLFLHHFGDEPLRELFAVFAGRVRCFASCDPRRWRPALFTTRFLWALGCNRVTRHDAQASVRAGFRDRELSALWPRESGCQIIERPGGYASHLFCAARA